MLILIRLIAYFLITRRTPPPRSASLCRLTCYTSALANTFCEEISEFLSHTDKFRRRRVTDKNGYNEEALEADDYGELIDKLMNNGGADRSWDF